MTAVAWVGGTPVDVSDVDCREVELRSGPVAPTLPREHTGEGRQLRRWLVQVLVAERLVATAARDLSLEDAPPLADIAPDRAAMLGLGSVAADLLTRNPLARAVFAAVTVMATVSVAVQDAESALWWNGSGCRRSGSSGTRLTAARHGGGCYAAAS